ncbi:phospholipid-binding protein [Tieghemostelium lacteum]|uniref:Phospholipid-binding protein n=1 Tax=Tieghemostelium lacteum TaxID=361077 RepID=A0A151Z757_TIELA|nr:phospholipid-binding protein [Tieghemostelium lacteum]|eukprot:KYQ89792.1 phospholipid-binding protein [Tieghemostelium lacteum]
MSKWYTIKVKGSDMLVNGRVFLELNGKLVGSTEESKFKTFIFKRDFTVEYTPSTTTQNLKFIIGTSIDSNGKGEAEETFENLISEKKKLVLVSHSAGVSFLELEVEDAPLSNLLCKFVIHGKDFDKKDLLGKSDPYYIISKSNGLSVYQSEVIKKELNPQFKEVVLSYGTLSDTFLIDFYDHNALTKHEHIGQLKTSVLEIISRGSGSMEIVNLKTHKSAGTVTFPQFVVYKSPSFMDYLESGVKLGLSIAIDFSSQNQNEDLHKLGNNNYEMAISNIGGILSGFNENAPISFYGYGGSPSNEYGTFSVPLKDPKGTYDVLCAYKNTLTKLEQKGEPDFTKVIQKVIDASPPSQPIAQYNILLLLSSGECQDIEATKKVITEASKHPISIIIVGNGSNTNNRFDKLKQLASTFNAELQRDTVQFISFKETLGSNQIAKETLKSFPNQIVSYLISKKQFPNQK